MAGAIISEVLGASVAGSVAAELEYELHTDAALDPFAFHADAHATRPSSPAT
ncbi:hypothetical protein ACFSWE_03385 [Leucobacter albus]|uniref:hypothetical protein n=1 Tax=Leucobacter albus TaxID=272210 RepID=UPI0031D29086